MTKKVPVGKEDAYDRLVTDAVYSQSPAIITPQPTLVKPETLQDLNPKRGTIKLK